MIHVASENYDEISKFQRSLLMKINIITEPGYHVSIFREFVTVHKNDADKKLAAVEISPPVTNVCLLAKLPCRQRYQATSSLRCYKFDMAISFVYV